MAGRGACVAVGVCVAGDGACMAGEGGVCGWGPCMAGGEVRGWWGMHGWGGGYAWLGGVHGWGGVHGCGGMCGMHVWGACVAGGHAWQILQLRHTVNERGGTHPTGMHSCYNFILTWSLLRFFFVNSALLSGYIRVTFQNVR